MTLYVLLSPSNAGLWWRIQVEAYCSLTADYSWPMKHFDTNVL
jgi:hypothetical protein